MRTNRHAFAIAGVVVLLAITTGCDQHRPVDSKALSVEPPSPAQVSGLHDLVDAAHAGIWKAVTPAPGTMHGEFANQDPIGFAAGVGIEADCSINWPDPDTGKLYCFSSATSLNYFLAAPRSYLTRAERNWRKQNQSRAAGT